MTRLLGTSLFLKFAIFLLFCGALPFAATPQQSMEVIPLSQIQVGMKGYAYTIFVGDQVEKFDLEVIGILPNFLGPQQSIILVELKGPKVEHTGVVAGMSGSPVYFDGKLAGALSLKLGIFTKEAIAGVTPIEDVMHPPKQSASLPSQQQFPLPTNALSQGGLPASAAMEPIGTPLIFSGFQPSAVQQFSSQLQSYGFVATQGGTAPAAPNDKHLAAGDMAGMVLVQGDASINSACTVTAVPHDDGMLYIWR